MDKVNHIIIVGGGSSAWLTAAYLSYNNSCRLTMVDKEHGKPIGVGEATLLNFQPFMESCGFKVEEWFDKINATYKTGILFPGWGKNGQSVWHPFVFGAYWPRPGELNKNNQNAFLIDCGKLVTFFQSKLNLEVIKEEVIRLDDEGLLLKNKKRLKADLYVDCTGFKSLLQKTEKIDLHDRLICDTAVAGHIPYKDFWAESPSYVVSEAVECGWIWTIPLQSRIGSGLVFNRTITPVEKAKRIFADYWNQRVGVTKVIDWTPYYTTEFWKDNVVRIGLSAGFIEPLESTGLALAMEGAFQLSRVLRESYYSSDNIAIYNALLKNFYEESIDFVGSHYTLQQRPEPFWRAARARIKKSARQLTYTKNLDIGSGQTSLGTYSFFRKNNWDCWLRQQLYEWKDTKGIKDRYLEVHRDTKK